MRSSIYFIIAIISVLTSACATGLNVTYNSDPPGATLVEGGVNYGPTPVTLNYKYTPEHKKAGFVLLRGLTVRWASGAQASLENLRANFSTGLNQQFTFVRPEGVPGKEFDYNYGIQVQQLRLQQQQLTAQQNQAIMQYLQNNQQMLQDQNQHREQMNKVYNCTSEVRYGRVYTQCH